MIPPLSKESSKLKFKATEESKPATNKELPTNKNSPDIAQKAKDLAKNHLKSETKILLKPHKLYNYNTLNSFQ